MGQDVAFQALTIRALYTSGARKFATLQSLVSELRAHVEERLFPTAGVRVDVQLPPMKGEARARDKALMRYGGDRRVADATLLRLFSSDGTTC